MQNKMLNFISENEMDSPSWAVGLCRSGTYYEGWVDDIDELLQLHSQETVTCYGTQRSAKALQKENSVKLSTVWWTK